MQDCPASGLQCCVGGSGALGGTNLEHQVYVAKVAGNSGRMAAEDGGCRNAGRTCPASCQKKAAWYAMPAWSHNGRKKRAACPQGYGFPFARPFGTHVESIMNIVLIRCICMLVCILRAGSGTCMLYADRGFHEKRRAKTWLGCETGGGIRCGHNGSVSGCGSERAVARSCNAGICCRDAGTVGRERW